MTDNTIPVIDKKTTLAELKEIVKGVIGGEEMTDILKASLVTPQDVKNCNGQLSELFAYRLGIIHGFAMRTLGMKVVRDFNAVGTALRNTKKGKNKNEQEG